MEPLEDALAGIASFDTAVEVVPVVQQSQVEGGMRYPCLSAQQGVGTIEQSRVMMRTNGITTDAVAVIVRHGVINGEIDITLLVVGL
jgi:hypothetical protein